MPLVFLAFAGTIAGAVFGNDSPAGASASGSPTEDNRAEQEAVALDVITVTAGRFAQSPGEVSGTLSVYSAEEYSASPALTMDDFLRRLPGFSLFRRSSSLTAHPTTQGVSLRGIGPSGAGRTLVLMDGIPFNDPFGGWIQWGKVSPGELERIEVMRGGGSTVWGNAAMGGVIHLITRQPEEPGYRVSGLAGNRSTHQVVMDATLPVMGSVFTIGGRSFSTGGYPVVEKERRGGIDRSASSRHWLVHARVDHEFGNGARVHLQGRRFAERRNNGTPLTNNGTDTDAISLRFDMPETGELSWNGGIYFDDNEFSSMFSAVNVERSAETPALDQHSVPSRTFGGYGVAHWTGWENALLTGGFDYRRISGSTNEFYFFSDGDFLNEREAGGAQDLFGLFAEYGWDTPAGWKLTAGGRIDFWRISNGRRIERERASGALLQEDRFPNRDEFVFSPRVGIVRDVDESLRFRASGYRAFRTPTINELYRPFRVGNDITAANAFLQTEALTGFETGLDWQPADGWNIRSTVYHNTMRNAVANVTLASGPGVLPPCGFVPAGGVCRQRLNLERLRIIGWEVEGEYNPDAPVRLEAAGLLNSARVRRAEVSPALEGNRIAQVPGYQLMLAAVVDLPKESFLRIQGRYTGEQFEDDLNERTLSRYWQWDLSAGFAVSAQGRLYAGIENVFNRVIEAGKAADGLVTTGQPRLFHAGVEWRF